MTYGLRLTNSLRDLAALHVLADAAADLLRSAWVEVTAQGAPGSVIMCPALPAPLATALAERGLDMVRVKVAGATATIEPLRPDAKGATWKHPAGRNAPNLLEALRPLRLGGDPLVDEACFWAAPDSPGAQKTLERLLLLGRDDVTVSEWTLGHERAFIVQVANPPAYLLMRAREEPAEQVRAYARAGDGSSLWVAWGYAHPLAHTASKTLKAYDRSAFVDADGTWHYAPADWQPRSIYDALAPELRARQVEMAPAAGETRFTIHLKLGAAPDALPELWLLDPSQFAALEPLVENAAPEEVARFTTARLTDARTSSVAYVLREIVRPNVPRLGLRVSDLLGVRGFARVTGTDNLYLPVGRRLVPVLRRDELRKLLKLDQAQLVLVDEDGDGPRVIAVTATEEVPLTRWIDYAATDRRVELDRLIERAVFDWPEVEIEKPPAPEKPKEEVVKPPRRADAPRAAAPRAVKQPTPEPVEAGTQSGAPGVDAAAMAALREEARRYEQTIAAGGCDDPGVWAALGEVKWKLRDLEEACTCLEAALFHGEASGSLVDKDQVATLLRWRAERVRANGSLDELVDLAGRAQLGPGEAGYLGARVLAHVTGRDKDVLDMVVQQAITTFGDGALPVSRRLAWLVEYALHRHADDKLGLTRAKERALGVLNDRGLSESHDLPGFVRFALALDEPGSAASLERTRADQLAAVETLWSIASETLPELNALSAYKRLTFAIGFMRVGAAARARDLVAPVESELPAHDPPNRILFKLYQSRLAFAATQANAQAWAAEVDGILGTITEARLKDRVEWLRKRSEWLRTSTPEPPEANPRPPLDALLAALREDPSRAADTLAEVAGMQGRYDFEKDQAINRCLAAALKTGSDDLVHTTLSVATNMVGQIGIHGHRATALGACVRAAATVGDSELIDRLVDDVIAVASADARTALTDLLKAIHPTLAALRRLGLAPAAQRLLDAMLKIRRSGERDGIALRAALSDGYLQLRDEARAGELLNQAIDGLLTGPIDHVGRYEGGKAVLAALKHWPVGARVPRCAKLIGKSEDPAKAGGYNLDEFRDTFTNNKYYETHKVLILEHLIDALTDDVTFRSDRVQGYLDAEEQVIRRKIIADWREVCGR